MGFVPTTLTLAVSAAVATSASSLKFSGVRYKSFGLTVKSLSEEGWITTYQRPYSHPTTSADLDRACAPEDQVIVAAMDTSFNLIVAACGECSSVMSQTKDRWEEHKHNGVSWYVLSSRGHATVPFYMLRIRRMCLLSLNAAARIAATESTSSCGRTMGCMPYKDQKQHCDTIELVYVSTQY